MGIYRGFYNLFQIVAVLDVMIDEGNLSSVAITFLLSNGLRKNNKGNTRYVDLLLYIPCKKLVDLSMSLR